MGETAQDIYFDLIKRIKAKVKSQERVMYDPDTGIQRTYIQGKLINTQHFTPNKYRSKGNPDESTPA
jgi:hypothetical protein